MPGLMFALWDALRALVVVALPQVVAENLIQPLLGLELEA